MINPTEPVRELAPSPIRLRKTSKRLSPAELVDASLSKERKRLADIALEIELKRKRLYEENRLRIKSRLEDLRTYKAQRIQREALTNHQLQLLRSRQLERQAKLDRIDWEDEQRELKRRHLALQQRKRFMVPIDFIALANPSKHTSTRRNTCRSTSLTNHQDGRSTPPRNHTRASDYVRTEIKENRDKSLKHKEEARLILRRRKEYGEQAQRTHHNARLRTEPNKYDLMDLRNQEVVDRFYHSQARKRRKPELPQVMHCDPVDGAVKEIHGIIRSNRNLIDKCEQLSHMSRCYLNKYDSGKSYGLSLAAQANLAMADLYLKYF